MKDIEITNQIEVIKRISIIIKDQIKEIEALGRKENLLAYENEPSLLVAYKNYTQLFVETIDFLVEKLETEKDDNFRFYLVHIRTLLDIFSSLLYILNQGKDEQIAILVLDSLALFSKSIKHKEDSGLKNQYKIQLNTYGKILKKLGVDVAEDPINFSNTSAKRTGYVFPKMEDILTDDIINNSCPQASKIPNLSKSLYGVQSHFSNYVHGHPFTAVNFGNEALWIIAKTEEISFAMSDLIDNMVLGGSYKYKIETWIRHRKKYAREFIEYWKDKSEKISANHKNTNNLE